MWRSGRHTAYRQTGALPLLFTAMLVLPLVRPASASSFEQPVVFCRLPIEDTPSVPRANGLLPADYGEGGSLVLLGSDGSLTDLAPEFASACDPDVSFDGTRILFAGQKEPGDAWNIWEVNKDGSNLRQITSGALDARQPLYLSTFYTITSSEPWYTILFVRADGVLNETAAAFGTSLYSVRLDGSELRRVTFHPGNDRTPYLMQDGLLLFSGLRSGNRMRLFGIQTDGIDYASYGATSGKRLQHMPTLTTDGRVVFVESDSFDWDGAGQLASVLTRRPHHSYQPLTSEGDGLFHSPSPLADGAILVSRRQPGDVLRIVRYSPTEGIDTIHGDPAYHSLHAKVVTPRPEPDGRSSTVRPEAPTGKLFCLDVYESDPALAALEPGSAKRLRVIEGLPLENPGQLTDAEPLGGQRMARRILGEAPVEGDGSFHIDLPADLAVQLQLLDAEGLALATCDWIWVKQREFRGCIGCHEDPELTPPNRFVEAARRPATELTAVPEERRQVTFRDDVAPLFVARCSRCHEQDTGTASAALTLGPFDDPAAQHAAFESLRAGEAPLVTPGIARTSPLVWRLLGRNTSRPWDGDSAEAKTVPDDHLELLTAEERATVIEWIDTGGQWAPTVAKGAEQ